jgi:hypothetical protein
MMISTCARVPGKEIGFRGDRFAPLQDMENSGFAELGEVLTRKALTHDSEKS